MTDKKQKNRRNQKLQLPPIKCGMCGRVIKNPTYGQKVCNYKSKKRKTKCQIKLNISRAKEQYKQAMERRKRCGGRVVLPKSVVCDQCGYDIAHPEYAPSSPTKLQMRCTAKNGRPGQRIVGVYSGCQVKYNNDHQREKRNEKRKQVEKIIKALFPKSNRKPASEYKTPDDKGPIKRGRPAGSATQKVIRGKYINNGDRKLRECLGKLCLEEGKVTMFMSAGPLNRQCERCLTSKENRQDREVKVAGQNNTCNVETQVLRYC